MKRVIFVISLFAVLLCSCATVQVAPFNSEGQVPVYMTSCPDAKYEEFKYIEVSGSIFSSPSGLMDKMQKKAKEVGADAVVNTKYGYAGLYPYLEGVAVKFRK